MLRDVRSGVGALALLVGWDGVEDGVVLAVPRPRPLVDLGDAGGAAEGPVELVRAVGTSLLEGGVVDGLHGRGDAGRCLGVLGMSREEVLEVGRAIVGGDVEVAADAAEDASAGRNGEECGGSLDVHIGLC